MTLLTRLTAFRDLPSATLHRLDGGSTLVEPHDGARIFEQGDPAEAVYGIVGGEGHVRIGSVDRHSKNLMVEVVGIGEIFGEIGVLDGHARTAEAVVEGRVRLLRIGASTFLAAIEEAPSLGLGVSRLLARRLRRTFALLEDASFQMLEVRLARQVLYLGDLYGSRTDLGKRLAGRFRQSDLADLLGTTSRSIITILNRWRADGLVKYDPASGQLTLRDEAALRELTDPKDVAS